MLSATLAPKMNGSCGTSAISRLTACGSALAMSTPSSMHRAFGRVVEALEQLEQRRLAGAGRADDRHHFARRDAEAQASEHRLLRSAGIGEADAVEGDLAARRRGQGRRIARRDDARLDGDEFADARRRAGGLRDLVPHFRQLAERAAPSTA